jgi:hypothetical protein
MAYAAMALPHLAGRSCFLAPPPMAYGIEMVWVYGYGFNRYVSIDIVGVI